MADADNGLGPWADADLAKTARMDAGTGADEGLPPKVRFVSNVAKLTADPTLHERYLGV